MDKINAIILDGNLHLLEQRFNDCLCNTCSLQRECEINAPNLCEIIFYNFEVGELFEIEV